MNKKKPVAFLIILSILMLSLKDSAALIHTILHYIPDNPWHQHKEIRSHHRIDPLDIHKYLQHKHSLHSHSHAHDVMDHIHQDESHNQHPGPKESPASSIKIDFYCQSIFFFYTPQHVRANQTLYFSMYLSPILDRAGTPPYQPPQSQS